MKNWNLIFRRTHLYLGMILLPWMVMYAVSTIAFNHVHAGEHGAARPMWAALWEKDYAADIPSTDTSLRDWARRVLDDNGLKGAFGVQRQGQRLTINLPNFLKPMRIVFEADRRKLRAEERDQTSASDVLGRLHTRTGYGRGGFLNDLWAVMVDVFCVATLVWIATGLYLWWKLPMTRGWGFAAMGGGVATIVLLLLTV